MKKLALEAIQNFALKAAPLPTWSLLIQYLSPTALALGSSAIIQFLGQKSFRTLYGSLGQVHLGFRRRFHQGPAKVSPRRQILLGLPKGSAEGFTNVPLRFHQGSAKVSPKFHHGRFNEAPQSFAVGCQKVPRTVSPRFHQDSPRFVVSLLLWGRSVLGCQRVLRKVSPRFHQGSLSFVVVPLRFHRRFHQAPLSFAVSLVLWGRSVLGCAKVPRIVPPRFRQVSTKVPPSFHPCSTKLF